MHTIQIAVTDSQYAADLARALEQAWSWQMASVESPDLEQDGVIVLDLVALNRVRVPLRHPERIVLIAHNDPENFPVPGKRALFRDIRIRFTQYC